MSTCIVITPGEYIETCGYIHYNLLLHEHYYTSKPRKEDSKGFICNATVETCVWMDGQYVKSMGYTHVHFLSCPQKNSVSWAKSGLSSPSLYWHSLSPVRTHVSQSCQGSKMKIMLPEYCNISDMQSKYRRIREHRCRCMQTFLLGVPSVATQQKEEAIRGRLACARRSTKVL